jgi:hypothetical protein
MGAWIGGSWYPDRSYPPADPYEPNINTAERDARLAKARPNLPESREPPQHRKPARRDPLKALQEKYGAENVEAREGGGYQVREVVKSSYAGRPDKEWYKTILWWDGTGSTP